MWFYHRNKYIKHAETIAKKVNFSLGLYSLQKSVCHLGTNLYFKIKMHNRKHMIYNFIFQGKRYMAVEDIPIVNNIQECIDSANLASCVLNTGGRGVGNK